MARRVINKEYVFDDGSNDYLLKEVGTDRYYPCVVGESGKIQSIQLDMAYLGLKAARKFSRGIVLGDFFHTKKGDIRVIIYKEYVKDGKIILPKRNKRKLE